MNGYAKRILTVFAVFICLFTLALPASAATKIALSSDVQTVDRGGEVTVSIDLGEEAQLHAYAAKLRYDKDVFDEIKTDSFQAQENWSDVVYNGENHTFGLINKSGESGTNVLKIKFKVKDTAKAGDTAIVVDSVQASDAGNTIDLEGASLDIHIKENILDNSEPAASETQINNDGISVKIGANKVWIAAALIALTVIAVVCLIVFIKKAENSKKKKTVIAVLSVLIALLLAGAIVVLAMHKTDVNQDGQVDYTDAKEVLEYLLEIKNEDAGADSNKDADADSNADADKDADVDKNADVDHNGKVDIGDVGNIVDDAGNKTKYEAELAGIKAVAPDGGEADLVDGTYYISKDGKSIKLGFEANVKPFTLVRSVMINGEEYPVEASKLQDNRYYYTVDIPVPEKVGTKVDMTVTQLVLDNGKTVDVNETVSLEVLKDKPALEQFVYYHDRSDYRISFVLTDTDGALVNGTMIVRGQNGEQIEVTPQEITAGSNEFTLKGLKPGQKYSVIVSARYDLDGEPQNGAHDGMQVLLSTTVETVDYGLTVNGVSAGVNKETKKAVIEFDASLTAEGHSVSALMVNGKEYAARRVEGTDKYIVEIPYEEEISTTYEITHVVLDNNYQVELDEPVSVRTFKTAPTVEGLELAHNQANSTLDAVWTLTDTDAVVSGVYVSLIKNGKVAETKTVSKDTKQVSFQLLSDKCAGDYTVTVAADFDLTDGQMYQKEPLASADITIEAQAAVTAVELSKEYAEKGETVDVYLTVDSNMAEDVTGVIVGGKEYSVEKQDDGRYMLHYTVGKMAGKETFAIEQLQYASASVEVFYNAAVEVLKTKPSVSDFTFDDSNDNHIVSFKLSDDDDAFVTGTLVVINEKGDTVASYPLDANKKVYTYKLSLKENGVYHISVNITYDLDRDKDDAANQASEEMASKDVEVLVDYQFTFTDAALEKVDYENKQVTIRFHSTNASKYYGVEKVIINDKEYAVTRDGDDYTVVVTLDSYARTTLTVTSAVLEDQRSFDVDADKTGFVVFKNTPVSELELTAGKTTVDVAYNILDADKTLRDFSIVLKDAQGSVIASKSAAELGNELSGNIRFDALKAGTYTAEVRADYDAADGLEHTDAVLTSKEIKVDIAAEITDSEVSKPYAVKGETVELFYTVTSNTDEAVTALTVNGRDYPAEKQDGNVYKISYTAGNRAGAENITVSAVKYSDVPAAIEHTDSIEVLKDVPTITDFDYSGKEESVISFTLTDIDDAFVGGSIVVTGQNDYTNEIALEKDKNTYDLGLTENGVYNVAVNMTYDLDSNKDDAANQTTVQAVNQEVQVIVNYKFTFTNAAVSAVNYDDKTATIIFNSTNASMYGVSKVVINGTEYDVVRDGDQYTVTVSLQSNDRTELRITKAILEDHKSFSFEQRFVVFKKTPTATVNAVAGDSMIDVSYIIVDQDSIAQNIKIVLRNASGDEVETKEVSDLEGTVSFSAMAGSYFVDVVASYDAVDGKTHTDEVLISDDVFMAIKVDGISGSAAQKYVNKNESVSIFYTVEDNTYEDVTALTVNGTDYTVEKQDDGTYKLDYTAGGEAKIETISVTGVKYGDTAVTLEDNCITEIEVLKDVPTVSDFDYNGNGKSTVSFKLNDSEDAFVSGTITVTGNDGFRQQFPVEKGKDVYDLALSENGAYTVTVDITYDRDSDHGDVQNQKTATMLSEEIQVIVNYKFTFTDAAIKAVDYDSKTVTIAFNSTNASMYGVAKAVINGNAYDVTRSGDTYTVQVTLESTDKTELVMTSVELEDHMTFKAEKTFVVFKNAPTATVNMLPGEDSLHVSYIVIDPENIAHDIKVVLYDIYGTPLDTKEVANTEGSVDFEIPTAGTYAVKVLATYDAVDGKDHTDAELVSEEYEFAIDVDGISGKVSKPYADKNETVSIFYTVDDNTYEDVKAITVNGKETPVELQADGTYKLTYTVGDKPGLVTLDVTAVHYENKTVNITCSNTLEVLKSAPTVSDFNYSDEDKATVSFKLNDADDAFISGKLVITGANGFIKEINIIKYVDTYELGLTENGDYNVSVNITYDLDSKKDDPANQTTADLASKKIQVIADYQFKFANFAVASVDSEQKFVILKFDSTNASHYKVSKAVINDTAYNVTGDGNTYTVKVPIDSSDRLELRITSVELENHKTFEAKGSCVAFKTAPTAVLTTKNSSNNVRVEYTLIDTEGIATDVKLVLRDAYGDVLNTVVCEGASGTADFAVTTAGAYKVEIIATYDAVDGKTHQDEVLKSEDVIFNIEVTGITATVSAKYVNKSQAFDIFYTVEDNTYENAASFTINGKDYPAELQDNGTYKVTYTASGKSGAEALNTTAVKYEGETVDVTCNSSVEVLKTAPTVTDTDFNGNDKAVVSFKLVDDDDAFVSGTLVITDQNGNTKGVVIDKNKSTYDLGLTENGVYTVSIKVVYDLDSDKNDPANRVEQELHSGTIQVFVDYHLTFTGLTVKSVDYDSKTVTLEFESTNASIYKVYKVVINGEEYEVTRKGNTYTVSVTLDNTDKTELKFSQVELEDHKKLDVEGSVTVFKDAPTAKVQTKKSGSAVDVEYTITDKDNVLNNASVVLRDANGMALETVPCDALTGEVSFTVPGAGAYKVEIVATYDAVDGKTHQDEVLKSEDVIFNIEVTGITATVSAEYVNKSQAFDIFYTIEDNTYENAASFTINGKDYPAELQDNGTYKVTYTASGDAGVEKLKTTAVNYMSDTVKVTCNSSVEVLKTAPTVTDTDFNGNDKAVVSFKLVDDDNTFISGKIVATDKDGITKEIPIEKNKSTYDLGLTENGVYTVSIKVIYDLDSDKDDPANRVEQELHSGTIQVFVDYHFTFAKPVIKSVDYDSKTVILEFESTNASVYKVSKVIINDKSYDVTRTTGNTYTVSVTLDNTDKTELKFSQAELEDHKQFNIEGSVTVFKLKPSASLTANTTAATVNASYTLTDEDETIVSASLVLKDSNGGVIDTKTCVDPTGTVTFDIEKNGTYTLEVTATYDAADGQTHVNEILTSEAVTVAIAASITESRLEKDYVAKGDTVGVYYTVKSNTDELLTGIIINGADYAVLPQSDDTYLVSYVVGSKPGLEDIAVSGLRYDSQTVKTAYNDQVEVLKDIPTADIIFDNSDDAPKLVVQYTDNDKALTSGSIVVLQGSEKVIEKTLDFGENVIDITSLSNNETYAVNVTAAYDLDQNPDNGLNQDKLLASKTLVIIKDYNFALNNLTVEDIDKENGEVTLSFESSNISTAHFVDKVVVNDKTYTVTKGAIQNETPFGTVYKYTVVVPFTDEVRQEFSLTEATLDNMKRFTGLTRTAVIFKDAPKADNISLTLSEQEQFRLSFDVTDADGALTALHAALKDYKGEVVQTVDLGIEADSKYEAVFEPVDTHAGVYMADITADYDLIDGNGAYMGQPLGSASHEIMIEIESAAASPNAVYVQKEHQVEITYTITDNALYSVKDFVIISTADGEETTSTYNVVRVSENGDESVYKVTVTAPANAGKVTYTLSKINYIDDENGAGYTAQVNDCKTDIEVLKDVPVNTYYTLDEDNRSAVFDVIDADGAVLNVSVTAKEKDTDKETVLRAVEKDGVYTVDLSALANTCYDINIDIAYDLDTDSENGQNEEKLTLQFETDFSIDYLASLNATTVTKVDPSAHTVTLELSADVTADGNPAADVDLQGVIVKGQFYPVTKNDETNTYSAVIPFEGESQQTITIEELTLTNGLQFKCNANNTVTIFKAAPQVNDFTVALKNGTVSAKFKLTDTENVLSAFSVVLKDASGAEVAAKHFTQLPAGGNVDVSFNDYNAFKAGTYTVSVQATYNRFDGVTHENKVLQSKTVTVDIAPAVTAHSSGISYAAKAQEFSITYTVTDNTDIPIIGFIINDTKYDAQLVEGTENQYTVNVKAPETAGEASYEMTQVVYDGDTQIALIGKDTFRIEVLKTAPTVNEYTVNSEYKSISFNIVDEDNALISGKVVVIGDGNEVTVSEFNTKGSHVFGIPFELKDRVEYQVVVKLTYDLDSDRIEGSANYTADAVAATELLEMKANYDISLHDIKVVGVNRDDKTVQIAFTAENDDETHRIDRIFIDDAEYYAEYDSKTGVYTVKDIPYDGETDVKQTVYLTKFYIQTGIEFDLTDKDVSFTVFKDKPVAENIKVTVQGDDVYVNFTLKDDDNTVGQKYVSIIRSKYNEVYGNTEIETVDTVTPVQEDDGSYTAKLKLNDIVNAYDFTVEVAADYDAADGESHVKEAIGNQTASVAITATILDDSVSTDDEDHLGGDAVGDILEKKQKIRLAFEITDNTESDVTRMVINGQVYNASKDRPTDNGSIYFVDVETPDEAGEKNFKVSTIYYGSKESDVNYETASFNILKAKPAVENYDDGGTKDEPYLKFTFTDVDHTLLDGKAMLTLTSTTTNKLVYSKEIEPGDVSIDFNDKEQYPDDIYELVIKASYNVYEDEAKKVTDDSLLDDNILGMEKRFQIKRGYNFNATLMPVELFEQGMAYQFFVFVNSLAPEKTITDLKIAKIYFDEDGNLVKQSSFNDKEIFDFNGDFAAFINDWGEFKKGLTYVYYESFTLNDGTELIFDQFSDYTIRNTYPTASKVTLKEDVAHDSVLASATISDPDNTINRLRFRLRAANGRILDEAFLSKNTISEVNDITFSKKMPLTSQYKLEVIAEYDSEGRGNFTTETLGTATANSAERVVVRDHFISDPYPNKGENVVIGYQLAHNLSAGIEILGAVINGEEVTVSSSSNDWYQFTMPAPTVSGVYDFTATAIILSNKQYKLEKAEPDEDGNGGYNLQPTDQADILKDAPYITDFVLEDDPTARTATFTFNVQDPDGALLEGNAGTATVNGNTLNITPGSNKLTFTNIPKDEEIPFDIIGHYDLDTNTLGTEQINENEYEQSILKGGEPLSFMLLDDYKLKISDLTAHNAEGEEERYFEKGTSIDLTFESSNKSEVPVERVVIDGKTYDVTQREDGTYDVKIQGYTDAGEKDISIDTVILNNGKSLDATEIKESAAVEILKDVVSVEKFRYTSNEDSMTLTIDVKDTDASLIGDTLDVTVTDTDANKPVATATISPGQSNTVTFDTTESRKYNVSIDADYTRNVKQSDAQKDAEIYQKLVSLDTRAIEMKEILDVKLFRVENGSRTEMHSVSLEDIKANLQNYVVRVDMMDLPSFYAGIESYEIRNDKLVLKINYETAVDYSEGDPIREYIEIDFYSVGEDLYAYEGSFEALLHKMQAAPTEKFVLTKDYDASTYTPQTSTYFGTGTFKGELDGNGHTITNMSMPLFDKAESAQIHDLYISKVKLESVNGIRAPLANEVKQTQIKNVHVNLINGTAYTNASRYGAMSGLVGGLLNGSSVSECSVTNFTFSSTYLTQISGGLVCEMKGSTISNCYTDGITTTGWWGNGGICGSADNQSTIENCISNHSLSMYIDQLNGSIVGATNGATLKNNISIARKNNGNAYKLYGGTAGAGSSNNYQLSDVGGKVTAGDSVNTIESTKLSEDFYRNELHLDDKIWDLTDASADKVPTLRGNKSDDLYVPGKARISSDSKYDASKELAYSNLYKLTPFYDASYIVEDAAQYVEVGDPLNTKKLNGIIPYDEDGNVVYALETDNYDKIAKIAFVYSDLTFEEHPVTFDIYSGDVACYDIPDLHLKYTYDHYVVNTASPVIDELVNTLLNAGNYAKAMDPLTDNKDARAYKYYYDEVLCNKDALREFVIKVLSNCNSTVTTNNSVVNTAICGELTDNNRLLKLLYTYNYFERWYNFDIEQFNIADMTMFKGDIFNDMMTFDTLSSVLLSNPATTMRTGATHEFYNNYLSSYTGISTLPQYLNFFIGATKKYDDVNDWFTKNFKGELIEVKLDEIPNVNIEYDQLKYRAWEHMSVRAEVMLPMLTAPEESVYIISWPTSMAMGSIRCYIKDPTDTEQLESFRNSMKGWANTMKTYYNMYLGILSNTDVVKLFNTKDDYLFDNTRVYEMPDAKERVWMDPATTNEPYFKWFGEPLGQCYYHPDNYAVATGNTIKYAQGNYFGNMLLFSHEAAHNQDGAVYFKGNGRRAGTNAESYTTGFFTQSFSAGSPQINGTYTYDENSNYSGNLTPERINSYEKINDFYHKMFQTSNFLDYLIGEAFLRLEPEQQAAVVSQIGNLSQGKTGSLAVKKADIEQMKLESINDLVDNSLVLGVGITQSLYDVRWDEFYSQTSVLNDVTFHYHAYQMLGYAGYDNGFVQYCGYIYKNDVEALRAISVLAGDKYQTFEEFKKGEFKKAADLKDKVSYIDADAVIEEFYQAFLLDASDIVSFGRKVPHVSELKEKYYLLLKKNTDDFRGEVFQEKESKEYHIQDAQQLVDTLTKDKYANIIIDKDLDFSAYTSGNSIVRATFLGTVDGNNHKLTHLSRPLFNKLNPNVTVKNLTIADSTITANYEGVGALARNIEGVTLDHVKADNVTVDSGGKNKVGGIIGYAVDSNIVNAEANGVTVSGGKEVGGVVGNLAGTTVTGGSVNTVSVTGTGDSIGGFAGEASDTVFTNIKINGATLTGRHYIGGLLGSGTDVNVEGASAQNVKIENARDNIGGLIGRLTSAQTAEDGKISHSTVTSCFTVDVTISGNTKLGGVIGYAEKETVIDKSSGTGANITGTADSVGGFVGEVYDTAITDCYAANAELLGRQYVGGFVGYTQNPTIKNCYAQGKAEVTKAYCGGFIGVAKMTSGSKAVLENNIAFTVVDGTAYKFDPSTAWSIIADGYQNNYEVTQYPGHPAADRSKDIASHINAVEVTDINEGFFKTTLKWSQDTWDLSNVAAGGLPRLQGAGNALAKDDESSFTPPESETVRAQDTAGVSFYSEILTATERFFETSETTTVGSVLEPLNYFFIKDFRFGMFPKSVL